MFPEYAVFAVVLLLSAESSYGHPSSCEVLLDRPRCGVPRLQPNALPSRPSEAIRGEFPWHAALFHEEDGNFTYCCGGSLINDRFVLTAEHCVINSNNGFTLTVGRLKVKLGVHELGTDDGCVQEVPVKKLYVHGQYALGDYKHDIALVELAKRVVYTKRVLPVCVDISDTEEPSFYRQYGKVAGWGYTEYDSVSNWLRMSELPFVNYTHCLGSNPAVFSNTIYEGMFCAGYANGTSVCNGDSGGGLVSYSRDRWIVRGIVSFTALREGTHTLCDSQEFAGFTKVRYYRDWLKKIIRGVESETTTQVNLPKEESIEEDPQIPCGERKINKRNLIVSGVRSFSGEWPWHVAVHEINGRQKRYLCGGTLISDQYVVTAAHCMLDDELKQRTGSIVVQLGQNDLHESSPNMREVRVGKISPHLQYDPVGKTNDIAILELTSNVQFNDYIQPACLPKQQDVAGVVSKGVLGSIVGWGYLQPWSFQISNVLQAARLPVVDLSNCVVGGNFGVETDGIICMGSANGTNACTGDSGGGMFIEKDGIWTMRGVISALDTVNGFCNPNGFLMVANTGHFLKWIKNVIKSEIDKAKGGDRKMTFLRPASDYPSRPAELNWTSTPNPSESHIHHHHHHHHHHYSDERQQQQQQGHRHRHCKDKKGSSSSESNESGLKAPIKRIFKKKKCLIKDLKDTLLSKLF